MMKMMKMMVVLVLSGVLCVSADVLHKDIALTGCSDPNKDGEFMYGLDGEELWYADFKNQKGVEPQPSFVDHMTYPGGYESAVANVQICKQNLANSRKFLKNPPVKFDAPSSPVVYSRDEVELGEENTLICHVTGFYPAPVEFSWTKNGQNVTEGTSVSVPYPNKDGSFNQFSSLVFTPKLGDVYRCSVAHLALDQPQSRFWDVEKTPPSIGPAVFCGLGLTVGLLGVAAGTFFLIKGNECS
ncbi:mamu class II histocompatibility antigen, DR alpha chain-like [Centropristis striata]|uniref:mamu class II histocompatibility antigen, DR alpha chain-like n=1 Tax=Centropristis striata TaxID=184440 RepID=UPI0027E076A7|nr:mamu class II histocompatibility antigen, DR alpha chain-like [Centropristis striata]